MATREVKDARDLKSGEKIYFKSHAKATYMSNGKNIQDALDEGDFSATRGIDHGTGDTTFALTPNVFHKWGTVTSLTLTLAAPADTTIYNEYMFEFVSGSTATTLSLPSTVKWVSEPNIEADKTYQCSIVNNIGVIIAV